MVRPKLKVADIFRRHGEAWRAANVGHVNLAQRRVMTAIEICRTAALGGHVERCQECEHTGNDGEPVRPLRRAKGSALRKPRRARHRTTSRPP
jgi:hypothetical protein